MGATFKVTLTEIIIIMTKAIHRMATATAATHRTAIVATHPTTILLTPMKITRMTVVRTMEQMGPTTIHTMAMAQVPHREAWISQRCMALAQFPQ